MANFNINKVILGGRLTADPDFLDCVAWRQTAEFICKYFKKGSSLCVVGNLQKREWQDKNGGKRYATEIIVDEALFVDSKNDAQGTEASAPTNYIPDAYKTAEKPEFEAVGADDDLPF